MKKILLASILLVSVIFANNALTKSADASSINPNKPTKLEESFNFFSGILKGREKFQENFKNDNFMLKGVISSSSSNSFSVENHIINIDSSVTGDVKITGTITDGAYAMVKGKIIDSKYYALRIVVNNRNKNLFENDNDGDFDDITPTPTPSVTITITPTITPTASPTPTLISTESAIFESYGKGGEHLGLNMNTLLEALHNILSSLRQFVLSV